MENTKIERNLELCRDQYSIRELHTLTISMGNVVKLRVKMRMYKLYENLKTLHL